MQPSPLSLDHYQLVEVEIRPENGYEAKADVYPDFDGADFESRIDFGSRADQVDEVRQFTVRLFLTGKPKEGGIFPYRFDLGVQGFFTVDPSVEPNKRIDFVLVNGAALLYGVLRDLLLTLTCRFENGPIMLPTVNFLNLKDVSKQDQSSTDLENVKK